MAIVAYLSGLLYIVAAFLLFLAGKLAYDFHRRGFNLNAELLERDNLALAIALSGYFLGLTLAVGGALAGTAPTPGQGPPEHPGLWPDRHRLAQRLHPPQ